MSLDTSRQSLAAFGFTRRPAGRVRVRQLDVRRPVRGVGGGRRGVHGYPWRRIVQVYENDVDKLYRVAFAYRQADSEAAERQRRSARTIWLAATPLLRLALRQRERA
jgi:hypothetical protein